MTTVNSRAQIFNDAALAMALSMDGNNMGSDDLAIAIALSMNQHQTYQCTELNRNGRLLCRQDIYTINNEYTYMPLNAIDGINVFSFHQSELLLTGYIRSVNTCIAHCHDLTKLSFKYFYITTTTVKQLKKKETTYEIKKLIFSAVCSTKYNNYHSDTKTLTGFLNQWESNNKMKQFRNHIIDCAKVCIARNNWTVLKIIFKHCNCSDDETQRLAFAVICNSKYTKNDSEIISLILKNWSAEGKMEKFRDVIIEHTKVCIAKHNVEILKIILTYCSYNKLYEDTDNNYIAQAKRMDELMEFINIAAETNAFECIKLLMKHPNKLDWNNQLYPIVLYNAVKYQHNHLDLIHFIINCLEKTNIRFICDDIMEEVIRYDVVEIGKRIVRNQWHEINENDKTLAKFVNLRCYKWITERSDHLEWVTDDCNCFNDEIICLDDDGWDDIYDNEWDD